MPTSRSGWWIVTVKRGEREIRLYAGPDREKALSAFKKAGNGASMRFGPASNNKERNVGLYHG